MGLDFDADLAVLKDTGKDFDEEGVKWRVYVMKEFNEFVVPDSVECPADVPRYHRHIMSVNGTLLPRNKFIHECQRAHATSSLPESVLERV